MSVAAGQRTCIIILMMCCLVVCKIDVPLVTENAEVPREILWKYFNDTSHSWEVKQYLMDTYNKEVYNLSVSKCYKPACQCLKVMKKAERTWHRFCQSGIEYVFGYREHEICSCCYLSQASGISEPPEWFVITENKSCSENTKTWNDPSNHALRKNKLKMPIMNTTVEIQLCEHPFYRVQTANKTYHMLPGSVMLAIPVFECRYSNDKKKDLLDGIVITVSKGRSSKETLIFYISDTIEKVTTDSDHFKFVDNITSSTSANVTQTNEISEVIKKIMVNPETVQSTAEKSMAVSIGSAVVVVILVILSVVFLYRRCAGRAGTTCT